MLTAFALAALAQVFVIVEPSEPVVYEPTVVQTTTYQYSSVPVVRAAPMVVTPIQGAWVGTYSSAYYMRADPLVRVYSPYMGGRTVIKERGPGFRGRTIFRY
jgi:hypothetical protein